MKCPKCHGEMEIMHRPEGERYFFGEVTEVLGRCEHCDFDATWVVQITYTKDGNVVHEYDLKQYFFG